MSSQCELFITQSHSRAYGGWKCAVVWWAVSHMLVVMHMTAHKQCIADMGYACQSACEWAFVIPCLMLIDWSSKDKKLLRGTTEDAETMWYTVSAPDREVLLIGATTLWYNTGSVLWLSTLAQWDWLCRTKASNYNNDGCLDSTWHLCSRLRWI